jgi:2,4-diaminopentanoate dehydrogenase
MSTQADQPASSTRTKPVRVVQCFTGGIGSECIRRIARNPDLSLVGVLVHSADKEGVDAGELVGIEPLGIAATRDLDEIVALRPDAAIWLAEGYDPPSLARLLAAGINVYTAMGGHDLHDQPERQLLEEACSAGRSTFAAAGNIPGLISDALPVFLSGFTGEIRHITAIQRNHVSHYRRPCNSPPVWDSGAPPMLTIPPSTKCGTGSCPCPRAPSRARSA